MDYDDKNSNNPEKVVIISADVGPYLKNVCPEDQKLPVKLAPQDNSVKQVPIVAKRNVEVISKNKIKI